MIDLQTIAMSVYVIGVLIGLAMIDARPLARLGIAICWPLGPAAFVVTISTLVLAALIAFPVVGVAVLLAVGGLVWWVWG